MIKCECGKTAYSSERKAKEQQQWIERQGKKLRVYKCPISYLWHLTSQLEPERRKK